MTPPRVVTRRCPICERSPGVFRPCPACGDAGEWTVQYTESPTGSTLVEFIDPQPDLFGATG